MMISIFKNLKLSIKDPLKAKSVRVFGVGRRAGQKLQRDILLKGRNLELSQQADNPKFKRRPEETPSGRLWQCGELKMASDFQLQNAMASF